MSKNIDFEIGTIVTDTFLDSVQELLTGSMHNLRLDQSGLGNDRVALSLSGDVVNDLRGTVNVGGKYCYTNVSQDSSPTSGAGTKGIYLSTTENGSTTQPNFDITLGAAPAASYIRRIGEAEYSGSQIYDVKLNNGLQADAEQYNAFTFRSVIDYTDETLLRLEGQSTQISAAGTYDSDPSATPTKALSVGENTNEHLYIDTQGRIVFVDNGGDGDVALQYTTEDGPTSGLTINRQLSAHLDSDIPGFGVQRVDLADDYNRFEAMASGALNWGDGTAPTDTSLYRASAGVLSLGLNQQIHMDYTIMAGDDVDILTNKEYVDAQVGSTLSFSKRFAFFMGR